MPDRVDWKEPLLGAWVHRLCHYCERGEMVRPPSEAWFLCRWCRSGEGVVA